MKREKKLKKGIAKKLLALTMSLTMVAGIIPGTMTGTVQTEAAELASLQAKSLEAAKEGIVLLKNDNHLLPLEDKKISVFGSSQVFTFWKGYGSGGYIESSTVTDVLSCLRESVKSSNSSINENLAKKYENYKKNMNEKDNPGYYDDTWRSAVHYNEELELSDSEVETAANDSDVAVVIIGRRWGEGRDLRLGKNDGSYYLNDKEKDLLGKVNKHFKNIVIVLNTASVMDMEWLSSYNNIDTVMYSWLGGMQTGRAIAQVLTGETTASGKLPVTIMDKLENEETYTTFGETGKNLGKYNNLYNIYEEDIYLGYRYSETFGDEHVLYPFGYGLSYTDFSITTNSITVDDKEGVKDDVINVDVTVKNTGSKYTGKEVVQVYYGAPQGVLGKPVKNLVAYGKTNELRPGETQKMKLSFTVDKMASYDETGKTKSDYRSSYVLEAGKYPIYVGNSVKAEQPDCYGGYEVKELTLVEKLQEVQAATEKFDRVVAKKEGDKLVASKEAVPQLTRDIDDRIIENLPKEIAQTGDKGIKLIDVYNGKNTVEEFIAQLSDKQIARLNHGVGGMGVGSGIAGNASAWGGADGMDTAFGIPIASTCDGPSGIRWSGAATAIPTAISLGSTWNDKLIEELCVELGKECIATTGNGNRGVDVLLAPGMNIIRDPRGGRNYEYFSEDPLLTGRLASAYVSGLQKVGVVANVKHFAAYQQGQAPQDSKGNNLTVDSRMSERCLREIYLKPFEIAIKESNPYTLMDSNGDINGEPVYGSYDLNTTILRNEWKWDGMVMTDWGPPESAYEGSRGKLQNMAHWVQSGCDVTMPGHKQGDYLINSIREKNNKGVSLAEAQRNAINVVNCIMKTMKFARDNKLDFYKYEEPEYEAFAVETQEQSKPTLKAIYLDGKKIDGFESKLYDYTIFARDLTKLPKITFDVPENTTAEAKTDGTVTLINVSSQDAVSVYKIKFTDAAGLVPTVANPTYAYLKNIAVNGVDIPSFYPTDYSYEIDYAGALKDAKITCDAPEGVTVQTTIDEENHAIVVRSESDHHAIEYTIHFISAPQSDDFSSAKLNDFWTVQNQNGNLSKKTDNLSIKTERGYFNTSSKDNIEAKNIVSQSAGGDWENETQVKFSKLPNTQHQAVGIILSDGLDRDNYIFFRIEYTSKGLDIRVDHETNGVSKEIVRDSNYATNQGLTNQLYFRVIKTGNEYTFAVRKNSTSEYTSMGSTTANFRTPTFSLAAYNSATDESITAEFHKAEFNVKNATTTKAPEPFAIKAENTNHCNRLYLADEAYFINNLGIEESSGEEAGHKNLSNVTATSYALYNVNVEEAGYYKVSARYASNIGSGAWDQLGFGIDVDGIDGVSWVVLGGTDGWQNWKTLEGENVYLSKGSHKMKLYFNTESTNLSWLEFEPTEASVEDLIKDVNKAIEAIGEVTLEKEPLVVAARTAYDKLTAEQKAQIPAETVTKLTDAEARLLELKKEPDTEEGLEEAKASLKSVVEAAEALDATLYTTESWTVFESVLTAAKTALENPEAKVEELNNAKDILAAAQQNLQEKDGKEPITDENLIAAKAALVETVKATTETYVAGQKDYTDESWQKFAAAYKAAAEVKEDASVEEITLLRDALEMAQNDLKKKEQQDPTEQKPPTDDKKPTEQEPPTDDEKPTEQEPPTDDKKPTEQEPPTDDKKPTEQEPPTDHKQPSEQNPPANNNQPATQNPTPVQNPVGSDVVAPEVNAIITDVDVKGMSGENDVSGSTYVLLQAKAQKQTKTSVKLKWNKVNDADGYIVYGSKCGSAYESVATCENANTTSYVHKKLKKGTYYKYLVCAYKNVAGGKAIFAVSKTVHTVTKGGKYGDVKAIKVSPVRMNLEVGDSSRLLAKEIKTGGKVKKHRKLSFESDNAAVATVAKSGRIKAKKKGSCYVYIYAQNGVAKRVKVTVK